MAKSNKRDADLISELWGQQPRWWEVWCAPAEVRDLRELLRYRMGLVRMQTAIKNQVHATLHRHGLVNEFADLFGRGGRQWLSAVLEDPASELRESGRRTLLGHLGMLDQVRRRIAQATRQFRLIVQKHPAARRLITLPGISTILGYTIVAEIGTIDRFASGRCLSRYSLMAPMSDDSGEEREGAPIGRHVGKIGRVTLKWAWIEAARAAVRKSGRMKDLFDRYTDNGKHDRNRGYIAVGHQLCLIAYALWKKDVDYQPTAPPRPGTEQWKQHQQADTASAGQPCSTSKKDAQYSGPKDVVDLKGMGSGVRSGLNPKRRHPREQHVLVSATARTRSTAELNTPKPPTVVGSALGKTPHPNGNVFRGERVKIEQEKTRAEKSREEKPAKRSKRMKIDVSRPGTGQPQAAMAAEVT
jgi:transposase